MPLKRVIDRHPVANDGHSEPLQDGKKRVVVAVEQQMRRQVGVLARRPDGGEDHGLPKVPL